MPWTAEEDFKLLLNIMNSSEMTSTNWDKVVEAMGSPHTKGSLKIRFFRIKKMIDKGAKEESDSPTAGKSGKSGKRGKADAGETEAETPSKKQGKKPKMKEELEDLDDETGD